MCRKKLASQGCTVLRSGNPDSVGERSRAASDLPCCTELLEASKGWRLLTGSEKDPVLQQQRTTKVPQAGDSSSVDWTKLHETNDHASHSR